MGTRRRRIRWRALLAASLPMPSRWHPGATGPAYQRHVASIERRMAKAAFAGREP